VKRLIILTGAAAMLLAAAACSSGGSSGLSLSPTASAASTSGSGGGGGESQSTSASGGKIASADQLANTQACTLLTSSEATQLGLPSTGKQDNAGAKSGCEWSGDEWDAIVGIRTDVGLSGVLANGGTIVPTTVGSHQAAKLSQGDSGCLYVLGVANSMRVDIQSGPVGTGDPCQESLKIAQVIEPKLP
jgi:hypothetical protein